MNGPLTIQRRCPVHGNIAHFLRGACVKMCPKCDLEALRAKRKL